MSMTRTDFKAIAEIVREYKVSKEIPEDLLRGLIDKLCTHFRQSNPTFDRTAFVRKCGWYGG
jgi:hypothetical protein